jgi:hypothetical protein
MSGEDQNITLTSMMEAINKLNRNMNNNNDSLRADMINNNNNINKQLTTIQNKNLFGKTINVVLTNIMSYDLGRDECKVRYELRFRDPNRESDAVPDTIINSGIWDVPSDVLNAWSGSNTYLADKMCEEFQLTKITHTLS